MNTHTQPPTYIHIHMCIYSTQSKTGLKNNSYLKIQAELGIETHFFGKRKKNWSKSIPISWKFFSVEKLVSLLGILRHWHKNIHIFTTNECLQRLIVDKRDIYFVLTQKKFQVNRISQKCGDFCALSVSFCTEKSLSVEKIAALLADPIDLKFFCVRTTYVSRLAMIRCCRYSFVVKIWIFLF